MRRPDFKHFWPVKVTMVLTLPLTYTGEGANGQAANKNGDMKGLNSQKEKVNNKFNEIGSHRSVKGGVNRNSQNSLHVQKNVSNCC